MHSNVEYHTAIMGIAILHYLYVEMSSHYELQRC